PRSSRFSHSASSSTARASSARASSGVGHRPRLHGANTLRIFVANTAERSMRVATDYIRHAARMALRYACDPFGGAPPGPPDAGCYRSRPKALEEVAAGMEVLGKEE